MTCLFCANFIRKTTSLSGLPGSQKLYTKCLESAWVRTPDSGDDDDGDGQTGNG